MTPLEQATQATLAEQTRLTTQVRSLEQELKATQEREAILKGRIEQLDKELVAIKVESERHNAWAVTVTRQLYNVQILIDSAMDTARQEFLKSNGKISQATIEQVQERMSHVIIQPQDQE